MFSKWAKSYTPSTGGLGTDQSVHEAMVLLHGLPCVADEVQSISTSDNEAGQRRHYFSFPGVYIDKYMTRTTGVCVFGLETMDLEKSSALVIINCQNGLPFVP